MKQFMEKNSRYLGFESLILLVLLFSFSRPIISVNAQPEPFSIFYSDSISFRFSGSSLNGVNACPWILNDSLNKILGINTEFRTFFHSDVQKMTAPYLSTLHWENFTFHYENVWHHFDGFKQTRVTEQSFPYQFDTSNFDPYYGVLSVEWDFQNDTSWYRWNNTIAPFFEQEFASKWYIERVKVNLGALEELNTRISFLPPILVLFSLVILTQRKKT